MLRKYIAAICASSLAAGAATAATLPVPAGSAFYISGSTALNNQLYADILQTGGICDAGSISVYIDSTLAGGGVPKAHQVAVVCTLSAQLGTGGTALPIHSPVAWVKESNGGSNEGTNNVANAIPLTFLNANVAAAGCAAGQPIAAAAVYAHQQAFTEFDSCTNTGSIVPTIGLADENPELFNVGQDAISPSAIAKLNSETMFQNGFGIAVSLNAYRALQRQQGLALTDTLATMPTLSRQQVAGLYTSSIDWSQIGNAAGTGVNAATFNGGTAAPATVFLCRRGDTSGTNVSADVFFLRNRCTTKRFPMTDATTSAANCNGLPAGETSTNFGCKWTADNARLVDTTFAGTGSGDVVSCLHAHDKNNQFAVGTLGTTSKFDDANGLGGSGDAVGSSHFRYVAIDGAKPTVISQANGTYTYVMDNVINTLKTLSGTALAASNLIQSTLTSTVPLADTFVAQPGGDANYVTGGILDAQNPNGVSPTGAPVTLAGVTSTPVSPLTLSPQGFVDDCQAPIPAGVVVQTVQE
jgi:hypothetical protein